MVVANIAITRWLLNPARRAKGLGHSSGVRDWNRFSDAFELDGLESSLMVEIGMVGSAGVSVGGWQKGFRNVRGMWR